MDSHTPTDSSCHNAEQGCSDYIPHRVRETSSSSPIARKMCHFTFLKTSTAYDNYDAQPKGAKCVWYHMTYFMRHIQVKKAMYLTPKNFVFPSFGSIVPPKTLKKGEDSSDRICHGMKRRSNHTFSTFYPVQGGLEHIQLS